MNTHDEIFEVLSHEPGTGVIVTSCDGRLLYINKEAVRIFFKEPVAPEELHGKNLIEMGFPKQWADERLEIFRRIQETNKEVLFRTIWQGKQHFSWIRPIDPTEDEPSRLLIVTRRISAGQEADHLLESELTVLKSEVTGLGELCVLTKRELEVLALIGQGLTAKQIAELMHRSVKTVENHRISLGAKLKKSNKVELALIAREAGLTVDDSKRARMCGL